jgi:hypothetical protein
LYSFYYGTLTRKNFCGPVITLVYGEVTGASGIPLLTTIYGPVTTVADRNELAPAGEAQDNTRFVLLNTWKVNVIAVLVPAM